MNRVAALSLLGFVFLLYSLGSAGLQTRNEDFIMTPSGDPSRVILILKMIESKDGVHHHTIDMESSAADRLLNSPKIGLLMLCDWTPTEIVSGEMVFSEKSSGKVTAVYRVKKGTVVLENRQLEFERASPPPSAMLEEQNVSVRLVSRGSTNLAVEGQFSEGEPASKFLWMPATSQQGRAGVASICGTYDAGIKGSDFSKAQLLSHTWGFGTGGAWIVYALIAFAAIAWILGLLAVLGSFPLLPSSMASLLTPLGAGLLFFSISLVFVILVPPFQAPDEPDHFLAYAGMHSAPDLALNALKLSNTGHFERIKFRTDEKFSTLDVDRPMRESWASHIEATDPNRSPIAQSIWSVLARLLPTKHAGTALLGIRVVNVLFVTLCLVVSLSLAARAMRPERLSMLFTAPMLLTPSLCFFSIGVSNYPFLVGGYVIQAVALGLLWAQGPTGDGSIRVQTLAAALIGGGVAIAVSAADNGLFALVFWAIVIPMYWFLRGIHTTDFVIERALLRRFSITFFAALLVGWLCTGLCTASFGILPLALPGSLRTILSGSGLQYLGSKTLFGLGFVFFVLSASYILAYGGWKAGKWIWLPFAKRALAVILILGLCFVVFARSPQIPEDRSSSIYDFTLRVVLSFFDWSGQGRNDFLVGQSFWGNFGWLDSPLPMQLVVALKILAVTGLACLVFYLRKPNRYFGGMGFLAVNLIALVVFVGAIATGYYSVRNIVNGRYLIGPYLVVLTIAYEGYRRLAASRGQGLPWEKPGICVVAMSVHCTAWLSILFRYF